MSRVASHRSKLPTHTNVQTLTHRLTHVFAFHHLRVIYNVKEWENQAKTECRHQKKSQTVATIKHWQTHIPSNRPSPQVHKEFVHIDASFRCIDDTCKGTKHDSSQLHWIVRQSLHGEHFRIMRYFLKHIPVVYQLVFPLLLRYSHLLLAYWFPSMNLFVENPS